jgi:hypothetical protein
MPIRAFVNPNHLSFIASGAVFALELEAPLVHTWVIYAIIGVLMALLLWRVATQWKNRSQEAQNLRITVIIWSFLVALWPLGFLAGRLSEIVCDHPHSKAVEQC